MPAGMRALGFVNEGSSVSSDAFGAAERAYFLVGCGLDADLIGCDPGGL